MNLRPACLWHQNEISSATALASGWGKMAVGKNILTTFLKEKVNESFFPIQTLLGPMICSKFH
jgi:hypothetical protein